MYQITEHSYQQAKRLGVTIKPSTNKKKKIDVFKNGEKIASIGAMGQFSITRFSRITNIFLCGY